MDILPLFCQIDDFCQMFEPSFKQHLLTGSAPRRQRASRLCLSEVMTIIVAFHLSGYRTFKDYDTRQVLRHLAWAFPALVSYNRFVELMPGALLPLAALLQTRRGRSRGVAFIDRSRLPSATTGASIATRSLAAWPGGVAAVSIGSTGSSSTW